MKDMKLKIKEEYKDYSIGGGRLIKVKLRNLDPSLYELYYKKGYKEFFEEVVVVKPTIKKVEDIENDTDK